MFTSTFLAQMIYSNKILTSTLTARMTSQRWLKVIYLFSFPRTPGPSDDGSLPSNEGMCHLLFFLRPRFCSRSSLRCAWRPTRRATALDVTTWPAWWSTSADYTAARRRRLPNEGERTLRNKLTARRRRHRTLTFQNRVVRTVDIVIVDVQLTIKWWLGGCRRAANACAITISYQLELPNVYMQVYCFKCASVEVQAVQAVLALWLRRREMRYKSLFVISLWENTVCRPLYCNEVSVVVK